MTIPYHTWLFIKCKTMVNREENTHRMDNMGVWLSPRQNNGRSRTNKLGKLWSTKLVVSVERIQTICKGGAHPLLHVFSIRFRWLKSSLLFKTMLLTITVLFMYILTAAKSKSAKSKWSSRHFLLFTARANVSRFDVSTSISCLHFSSCWSNQSFCWLSVCVDNIPNHLPLGDVPKPKKSPKSLWLHTSSQSPRLFSEIHHVNTSSVPLPVPVPVPVPTGVPSRSQGGRSWGRSSPDRNPHPSGWGRPRGKSTWCLTLISDSDQLYK